MIKNNIQYIIIGLLLIIFFQGIFSSPEGISEEELIYQLAIDSLKDERIKDLEIINELQNINTIYENLYDSLEKDNSIDTFTVNQLQFSLSNYANKRR